MAPVNRILVEGGGGKLKEDCQSVEELSAILKKAVKKDNIPPEQIRVTLYLKELGDIPVGQMTLQITH